ncbi:MAG: arginine repressor [Ruminococcus sp.]|nr:arginine repressor [Ruminococcus sp.]
MTKAERHGLILRLVQEKAIDTQEKLQSELLEQGVRVTQATLSRDMKELALIKLSTDEGYRYAAPKLSRAGLTPDSSQTFDLVKSAVVAVDSAMNTLVIKCHTGMAQAVCAKLDSTDIENAVGTIAGDDTIFMLMRTEKDAQRLVHELEVIIQG